MYLPSEIARLVLGYLRDVGCQEAADSFLKESPDLREFRMMMERGFSAPLKIGGVDLNQALSNPPCASVQPSVVPTQNVLQQKDFEISEKLESIQHLLKKLQTSHAKVAAVQPATSHVESTVAHVSFGTDYSSDNAHKPTQQPNWSSSQPSTSGYKPYTETNTQTSHSQSSVQVQHKPFNQYAESPQESVADWSAHDTPTKETDEAEGKEAWDWSPFKTSESTTKKSTSIKILTPDKEQADIDINEVLNELFPMKSLVDNLSQNTPWVQQLADSINKTGAHETSSIAANEVPKVINLTQEDPTFIDFHSLISTKQKRKTRPKKKDVAEAIQYHSDGVTNQHHGQSLQIIEQHITPQIHTQPLELSIMGEQTSHSPGQPKNCESLIKPPDLESPIVQSPVKRDNQTDSLANIKPVALFQGGGRLKPIPESEEISAEREPLNPTQPTVKIMRKSCRMAILPNQGQQGSQAVYKGVSLGPKCLYSSSQAHSDSADTQVVHQPKSKKKSTKPRAGRKKKEPIPPNNQTITIMPKILPNPAKSDQQSHVVATIGDENMGSLCSTSQPVNQAQSTQGYPYTPAVEGVTPTKSAGLFLTLPNGQVLFVADPGNVFQHPQRALLDTSEYLGQPLENGHMNTQASHEHTITRTSPARAETVSEALKRDKIAFKRDKIVESSEQLSRENLIMLQSPAKLSMVSSPVVVTTPGKGLQLDMPDSLEDLFSLTPLKSTQPNKFYTPQTSITTSNRQLRRTQSEPKVPPLAQESPSSAIVTAKWSPSLQNLVRKISPQKRSRKDKHVRLLSFSPRTRKANQRAKRVKVSPRLDGSPLDSPHLEIDLKSPTSEVLTPKASDVPPTFVANVTTPTKPVVTQSNPDEATVSQPKNNPHPDNKPAPKRASRYIAMKGPVKSSSSQSENTHTDRGGNISTITSETIEHVQMTPRGTKQDIITTIESCGPSSPDVRLTVQSIMKESSKELQEVIQNLAQDVTMSSTDTSLSSEHAAATAMVELANTPTKITSNPFKTPEKNRPAAKSADNDSFLMPPPNEETTREVVRRSPRSLNTRQPIKFQKAVVDGANKTHTNDTGRRTDESRGGVHHKKGGVSRSSNGVKKTLKIKEKMKKMSIDSMLNLIHK